MVRGVRMLLSEIWLMLLREVRLLVLSEVWLLLLREVWLLVSKNDNTVLHSWDLSIVANGSEVVNRVDV